MANESERKEKKGFRAEWLIWIAVSFLIFYSVSRLSGPADTQIAYSSFIQLVENGRVHKVGIEGNKITVYANGAGEAANQERKGAGTGRTVTYVPSFGDNRLLPLLREHDVEIVTRAEGLGWSSILLGFGPILLLLFFGYLILRGRNPGGQNLLSIGRSKARLYEAGKTRVTFEDIAGATGAKTELEEIIDFLKKPDQFHSLGGKMPKGMLLVGPPGTGKTLLARAVAGEAGVSFFSITGSAFMEMFVGVGASRVRSMFEEAKNKSPSIIFIDELDSIGRKRGSGIGGGHDEREQTLNQLLSELDGFEPHQSVIVMAATNRPDILDPALLRPGRFDRRVTVDLPTLEDRFKILQIHARGKPIKDAEMLRKIARGTPGFSGADLANILNEAALLAARKEKKEIDDEDVDAARDKIMMGMERENLVLTEQERKLLAYHEGGHSVVAAVLPHADPVHKVTIVPRGKSMGVTQQLPERDKYVYSRDYMLDRLAVMMGGRAAEQIVLDTQTSGAESDLKQATRLARMMVLDWGMSNGLGPMALGSPDETSFLGQDTIMGREYSEKMASEIDGEMRKLLSEAYDRAVETLKKERSGLDRIAEVLIEQEEMSGEAVLKILGRENLRIKEEM